VSGTTAFGPDGEMTADDAFGQTQQILRTIVVALAEAGAKPEDVVRTVMYVTDIADAMEVGRPMARSLPISALPPPWLPSAP